MKCAVCHHEMVEKTRELDLRLGGRLFLVRNVSYEERPSCGEKVLSPAVSQDLSKKIERRNYVEQTVNIPVLYGAHGAEGHESTAGSP